MTNPLEITPSRERGPRAPGLRWRTVLVALSACALATPAAARRLVITCTDGATPAYLRTSGPALVGLNVCDGDIETDGHCRFILPFRGPCPTCALLEATFDLTLHGRARVSRRVSVQGARFELVCLKPRPPA